MGFQPSACQLLAHGLRTAHAGLLAQHAGYMEKVSPRELLERDFRSVRRAPLRAPVRAAFRAAFGLGRQS